MDYLEGKEQINLHSERTPALGRHDRQPLLPTSDDCNLQCNDFKIESNNMNSSPRSAQGDENSKVKIEEEGGGKESENEISDDEITQEENGDEEFDATEESDMFLNRKRYATSLRTSSTKKAKGAISYRIPELKLKADLFEEFGDPAMVDQLLEELDGDVSPGGTRRFRRWRNAEGAIEYWVEDADLVNIRKEAGVNDPYFVRSPIWRPVAQSLEMDYLEGKEQINLHSERTPALGRHDRQPLLPTSDDCNLQCNDFEIESNNMNSSPRSAQGDENSKVKIEEEGGGKESENEINDDEITQEENGDEEVDATEEAEMFLKRKRYATSLRTSSTKKAKGAIAYPIPEQKLKADLLEEFGDPAVVDQLLEELDGDVSPGGTRRLRRWRNAEGAIEYWVEDADLVNIRKEAGVNDPFFVRSPIWRPVAQSPEMDYLEGKEQINLHSERTPALGRHDRQPLLPTSDDCNLQCNDFEIESNNMNSSPRSAQGDENSKVKIEEEGGGKESENEINDDEITQEENGDEEVDATEEAEMFLKRKRYATSLRTSSTKKAKGAIAYPIPEQKLKADLLEEFGDPAVVDQLLEELDGDVSPGGTRRLRRWRNAEGAIEYWVEDADLVNIRKEAGVNDPFFVRSPIWRPVAQSPEMDYLEGKEQINLHSERTPALGRHDRQPLLPTSDDCNLQCNDFKIESNNMNSSPRSAQGDENSKVKIEEEGGGKESENELSDDEITQEENGDEEFDATEESDMFLNRKRYATSLRTSSTKKAKGAISYRIPELKLKADLFEEFGDPAMVDQLLEELDGDVSPGGTRRFRRWRNAEGAIEYWVEDADLVNIRKEAGVNDPYFVGHLFGGP